MTKLNEVNTENRYVGTISNCLKHKKHQHKYCRNLLLKDDPKAITLIALVITIIILIILAGVAISLTIGENGLFNKVKYAKEEYKLAQAKEELEVEIINVQTIIMEEQGRNATLEDLQSLIDTSKYEIVLHYEQVASSETITQKSTYAEVKEIESKIKFIVDDKLVIRDVELIDKNESSRINNFDISIENANGSYLTINASNATTNDGSTIQLYKYYVNGEKMQETTEDTFTVTNLELNTEYSIKVITVDEDGKEKASSIKKYTTANVQYLYKNGDTCDTITGGYATGATTGATITYNTDNIQISSSNYTYVFAVTNNQIDFSQYSKLHIKLSTNTECYTVRLGSNKNDTGDTSIYCLEGSKTGNDIIETMDISQLNESSYLKLGKHNGATGTIKYYEVWLEE